MRGMPTTRALTPGARTVESTVTTAFPATKCRLWQAGTHFLYTCGNSFKQLRHRPRFIRQSRRHCRRRLPSRPTVFAGRGRQRLVRPAPVEECEEQGECRFVVCPFSAEHGRCINDITLSVTMSCQSINRPLTRWCPLRRCLHTGHLRTKRPTFQNVINSQRVRGKKKRRYVPHPSVQRGQSRQATVRLRGRPYLFGGSNGDGESDGPAVDADAYWYVLEGIDHRGGVSHGVGTPSALGGLRAGRPGLRGSAANRSSSATGTNR